MMKKVVVAFCILLNFFLIIASIIKYCLDKNISVSLPISTEGGPTSIFIAGHIGNDNWLYFITVVLLIMSLTAFLVGLRKK
ncbi:hypothetical protein [Anaerosacchariphilus polymeriproducens]|uniref:Oxaloacetate decarboxylase n=1 Tax=Anaerosacchariphilus polymeriproducens TaxID=1812858 RepID=A0A371ASC7_9FIRM|nr:hypothetical protein [Anaerosacchariphilus polymeriproducens]RDU22465.1 hypothetical protein DWV06_14335 [Anaerosacchariphilus polymeriproducens]